MEYRLEIVDKHNESKTFWFETYDDMEYNFSLCYYSNNIVSAVGYHRNNVLLKF